jgi:hypothetical protein
MSPLPLFGGYYRRLTLILFRFGPIVGSTSLLTGNPEVFCIPSFCQNVRQTDREGAPPTPFNPK